MSLCELIIKYRKILLVQNLIVSKLMMEVASFSGIRTSWSYSQTDKCNPQIYSLFRQGVCLSVNIILTSKLGTPCFIFRSYFVTIFCKAPAQSHACYMFCHNHPKTVYWIQFRYNYFCRVYCNIYVVRVQKVTRKLLNQMTASVSRIS
jgi:hypothetical protein